MPYLVPVLVTPEHEATAANEAGTQTAINKANKNKILLKTPFLTILFFGIFFPSFIVKRPAKTNLSTNNDIPLLAGRFMRKIYQKKKQVNCFMILSKRPNIRHSKKWQENEASDCQKVMEAFCDRICIDIEIYRRKF